MSLLETDESKSKRIKFENNSGNGSWDIMEEKKQETINEDSNIREISCTQDQEKQEKKVNSDNETIIDSDEETFTFPPDSDITDMLDEVEYNGYFPTVTDRYFTPYYKLNVQLPGDNMCIWIHSNRVCMLSLAPSHFILRDNKGIKKVDFKVSDKLDRSLNKVSGKGKHGAQPLQVNSNICTISCLDGQTYVIKCCIIGKLIEVNEMLSEDPQLLKKPPHKGGYLAIILPNIKLLENLKNSLLTRDEYIELNKEKL